MADKNFSQFNEVTQIARTDLMTFWKNSESAMKKIQLLYFMLGHIRVVAPLNYPGYADYWCDGVDDEVQFNLALVDLASVGGGFVIPAVGNYFNSNAINFPSNNLGIKGIGRGAYIKMKNGASDHGITISGKDSIFIDDIFFDHNGQNSLTDSGNHAIRIAQASSNIYITRSKIINAQHHIVNSVLDDGYNLNKNIQVQQCELFGNGVNPGAGGAGGVCIALRAQDSIAEDNTITDTQFCGIELYHEGKGCKVKGNTIIWNGTTGCLGAIQVGTGHDNAVVEGNEIYGTGVASQAAIKVIGCNGGSFSNNTIHDLTNGLGVWITGAADGEYVGNTLRNLADIGFMIEGSGNAINGNNVHNALTGAYLRPTAIDNKINSNTFKNNQQYGVFIHQSAHHNTINDNHAYNNSISAPGSYDGIHCEGGNNTINDNYAYDNQTIKTQRYGIQLLGSLTVLNSVQNNDVNTNAVGGISLSSNGAGNIVRNNQGFVTENSGTAVVASGTTSIVVTHGVNVTPNLKDITITPTNNLGTAAKFWVSNVTATQFTINVNIDPGAATAAFAWRAIVL